jgi:hypothetical protein
MKGSSSESQMKNRRHAYNPGMPNLTILIAALATTVLAAQAASSSEAVAKRLVGAWEMVSFETIAADGTRRPGAYDRGQITYDASGRMSAQLMSSANKADAAPQTDEARAAAYRRYLGYYGPFVVDEAKGIVTHIVEGSSNPSWVGSRQVRYYELSEKDAQLTLMVKNAEGRVTSTLVWKRSRP